MSTIPYDGLNPTVFANQNSDKKINIYGLTLGFNAKIWGVIINQDVNLTRCKNTNYGKEPFAHIPPVFGKLEILKEFNNWKFRFLCLFSGPKDSADFDAADVDNLSETPVINEFSNEGQVVNQVYAGLPGWYTLNLSTQYKLNKNIIFQFGVDNILDAHYKTFGSGLSAPGRNFITSINYSF